jgi:hypothetical protein
VAAMAADMPARIQQQYVQCVAAAVSNIRHAYSSVQGIALVHKPTRVMSWHSAARNNSQLHRCQKQLSTAANICCGSSGCVQHSPKPSGAPTALLKPTPMDITNGTVTAAAQGQRKVLSGQAARICSDQQLVAAAAIQQLHLCSIYTTAP